MAIRNAWDFELPSRAVHIIISTQEQELAEHSKKREHIPCCRHLARQSKRTIQPWPEGRCNAVCKRWRRSLYVGQPTTDNKFISRIQAMICRVATILQCPQDGENSFATAIMRVNLQVSSAPPPPPDWWPRLPIPDKILYAQPIKLIERRN